jgi:hypothetical protein
MRIDKRLNIALPIDDDGTTLWVHSVPISREIFERYWEPISRTMVRMSGVAGNAAPRIAALALKDVATELGQWEDRRDPTTKEITRPGVERGLLAEIRRLTSVVVLGDAGGWQTLPYDVATQQGKIDPETAAEVESFLVFFTVASWMNQKSDLPVLYETIGLWRARAVSLTSTEFASSLPTSIETANSGPKVESSVPS